MIRCERSINKANETFVKSMENNKQEDFKELNNMIQFYEKLLFWRKN